MSEFTVHTGALRTMADSCTAAARAVESVCADLPPAARTLADRLESDTAALRRLADAAEEIAAGRTARRCRRTAYPGGLCPGPARHGAARPGSRPGPDADAGRDGHGAVPRRIRRAEEWQQI